MKKNCKKCNNSFETTIEKQDWCLPCLLKPSRAETEMVDDLFREVDEKNEKYFPKKQRNYKTIPCDTCGNEFVPTGPRGKTCPDCKT
ncbi:MAG: hypothetical protein M0R06_08470 [Sphaerochaeta sp.]|jgi:hypothetical protein|nr:hypothetical protein [Sphaerochaeta sp.]